MMEQDVPQERSSDPGEDVTEERFLKELYLLMKERGTPIERIPHLGFKQIDMFLMYKTVKDLGGYQQVTTQQLWKKVYNILGGNPRSTSAATCTRRHYEKLLLPYECHQTGFREEMVFRTPRPQKRFHPGYLDYEQDYPLNDKRPDLRHLASFPQTSPSMFLEHHRQMLSMPLNTPPYFSQGRTSLSNYLAHREAALPQLTLNPPLDLPQIPASYLSTPSMDASSCKQSINNLRLLAEEYRSMVGLEEPLNLSQRENKLQTLSDTPSSFSPCSKKTPFLNEATTLYPARSLSTDDVCEQGEQSDGTSSGEGGSGSVRAGLSPVKADVIDLTSSSSANPVPRRASPPSVNLFNRRPLYSEGATSKTRERDHHAEWLKVESSGATATKLGILNRSNSHRHPSQDPNSNTEIQIPLKFLQELIRRGFISSPASTENNSAYQDSPKTEEHRTHVRSTSESCASPTSSEEPTNLSLKSPLKSPPEVFLQDKSMKRLFGSSGFPAEMKHQVISPLKLTLDRDPLRSSQVKLPHVSMPKSQEIMNPRPRGYSVDTPLTQKSEKLMVASNHDAKEISTSPPIIPEHLRFLLANLNYRLDRGRLFDNVHI
ncbi:hypothetical protein DNTS_005884 [Danionella cerebrum]|uniref:ARID domain-containing protein n=1 Tax=Danionella cerebrum TaxID=2873325 RepID=A0A553R8X2_9TELE|nr:hypothetical protein DNTS_005884 [Danionella translucida]